MSESRARLGKSKVFDCILYSLDAAVSTHVRGREEGSAAGGAFWSSFDFAHLWSEWPSSYYILVFKRKLTHLGRKGWDEPKAVNI